MLSSGPKIQHIDWILDIRYDVFIQVIKTNLPTRRITELRSTICSVETVLSNDLSLHNLMVRKLSLNGHRRQARLESRVKLLNLSSHTPWTARSRQSRFCPGLYLRETRLPVSGKWSRTRLWDEIYLNITCIPHNLTKLIICGIPLTCQVYMLSSGPRIQLYRTIYNIEYRLNFSKGMTFLFKSQKRISQHAGSQSCAQQFAAWKLSCRTTYRSITWWYVSCLLTDTAGKPD